MKIRKTKLDYIYETLDEVDGFLVNSLDFIDEYQLEYVRELLTRIEKSLKYIDSVNKGE